MRRLRLLTIALAHYSCDLEVFCCVGRLSVCRMSEWCCVVSVVFPSMATSLRAFWNSPVGPRTIHFWGPMANFGFVAAGLVDIQKPPEMISGRMTSVMCAYSAAYMRFAWMVRPQNLLLCGVHGCNEAVYLYQLQRWGKWAYNSRKPEEELTSVSSQEER